MIDYKTKCSILADLWDNYRHQEDLLDFVQYNDIGLPLAYMLREGLVQEITQMGIVYVNETFDLLLAALELKEEDVPEEISFSDLLEIAEKREK